MRLIDADALYIPPEEINAKMAVACAPTIDAVPYVVRCKDCKWFGKKGCAIEVVDETDMPKENDFCSFAERREDETD